MQKMWFVIFALDQVLSANVLSTYLSGQGPSELSVSPNASFSSLKNRLAKASKMLEPFINPHSYGDYGGFAFNPWIKKVFKGIKEVFNLQRVIDSYLVDFSRTSVVGSDA